MKTMKKSELIEILIKETNPDDMFIQPMRDVLMEYYTKSKIIKCIERVRIKNAKNLVVSN